MVKSASVKILPSPLHDTNHNNCIHKTPLTFTSAFWAAVPSDLARWLSADMICEIVELAEDNYSAVDIPEIIDEREGNYVTGYVVNLLPGTVRRVLELANYGVGYQMAEIMAKATKEVV